MLWSGNGDKPERGYQKGLLNLWLVQPHGWATIHGDSNGPGCGMTEHLFSFAHV